MCKEKKDEVNAMYTLRQELRDYKKLIGKYNLITNTIMILLVIYGLLLLILTFQLVVALFCTLPIGAFVIFVERMMKDSAKKKMGMIVSQAIVQGENRTEITKILKAEGL